jgi:hypothetical protein
MMNVPERLTHVTHPLVSSIYLKKDYGSTHNSEDVLVIETNFTEASDDDGAYDACLTRCSAICMIYRFKRSRRSVISTASIYARIKPVFPSPTQPPQAGFSP